MSRKAIVYYSYSNNTKKIVDEIIKSVKADVYEIKPVIPYPDDYEILVEQEEHKQGKEEVVEIEDLKINLKDYDTIILGTPVWWYTMAPPVRSFLKNNDLKCLLEIFTEYKNITDCIMYSSMFFVPII